MRVYVAGHNGLVGRALVKALVNGERFKSLDDLVVADKGQVDLRDRSATLRFFMDNDPIDWVFLPAAVVGGIHANNARPVEFLDDNLRIASNVMAAAATYKVKKLMFFGSSCIYPKFAPQPIKETALLTGELEPTNQWYAIAKIAGLKLAEAYWRMGKKFISVMPTNLYGPGDNYDPKESHVIPSMIHKFHQALVGSRSEVSLFGDGTPMREFLHVDDLAEACLKVMDVYNERQFINIGSGEEISICDLAIMVAEVVGFNGIIHWNTDMPNGTPRKFMDSSRVMALGWKPRTALRDGITQAYQSYLRTPFCRVN